MSYPCPIAERRQDSGVGRCWPPGHNHGDIRRTRVVLRIHAALVAGCMALCCAVLAGTVGQARAAIYVVDPAAFGAADTNPGTEQKPFKTVQRAADAARPGDAVY